MVLNTIAEYNLILKTGSSVLQTSVLLTTPHHEGDAGGEKNSRGENQYVERAEEFDYSARPSMFCSVLLQPRLPPLLPRHLPILRPKYPPPHPLPLPHPPH